VHLTQDELAAELDAEVENVDSNGVDPNVVGGSSSTTAASGC